jgi:hypothetical protein
MSGMPGSQVQQAKVADPEATARLVQLARAHQRAHRPLTEEEQNVLANEQSCMHCGGFHTFSCRRVKSLSFQAPPGRGLASVEYWPWSEVDWTGVIWDDGGETDVDQVLREAGFDGLDKEQIVVPRIVLQTIQAMLEHLIPRTSERNQILVTLDQLLQSGDD